MDQFEYRKVIYDKYVHLQSGKLHKHDKKEYERFVKFYIKKYKQFLPKNKDARILDAGCGAGFFLYFLKQQGYTNGVGIDLSEEQLKIAKSYGLNVHKEDLFDFFKSNAGQYELIFSSHVIEHLTKNEGVSYLMGMQSCLRSGGKVIVCTPNALSMFGFGYLGGDITHEVCHTPMSLFGLMEACGFKMIGVYPEWPVAVDFNSSVRVILWNIIKPLLRGLFVIQSGTDLKRAGYLLLENYMFAVVPCNIYNIG